MVRPKTRLQTISTYLTYTFLLAFVITFVGLPIYYSEVCSQQPNAKDGRIYAVLFRGTNNKVVYLTKEQKHSLIYPVGLLLLAIMTSYGIYPKE